VVAYRAVSVYMEGKGNTTVVLDSNPYTYISPSSLGGGLYI